MSKYLKHTPKNSETAANVKKGKWRRFLFGMMLYALVFLGAAAIGLKYLWAYLESYENSRPKNTVEAYINDLTVQQIVDMGIAVRDRIDGTLQSEDECRQVIAGAIADGVDYAKNSRESTDTRQVYVLRSGGKTIGNVVIEAGRADKYGFSAWSVTEGEFDFSCLIGDTASVTVPSDYIVSANGHVLNTDYVTRDRIPYAEIEALYEDHDLPYQLTYTAGPVLGTLKLTVTDPSGEPVTVDESTDWSSIYHNCTAEETQKLDAFTEEFLARYVAFTGSNKNTRNGTYSRLMEYVVADSGMAVRLGAALEGLQFGQSRGDEVVSIETHHQIRLEAGKYLCDITYEVDTTGKQGVVRTATSARLTVVQTDGGLMLDALNIY